MPGQMHPDRMAVELAEAHGLRCGRGACRGAIYPPDYTHV